MSKNERNTHPDTATLPTARIGGQAGIALSCQWDEFCRLQTVVLSHHDTDDIHDLRVASRRLRATLGLLAPFLSAQSAQLVSKEIRRVTQALGHVRNLDEAMIYLDALPMELPLLVKRLRRARMQEIKAVVKVLKGLPRRKMDRRLREAVAAMAAGPSRDSIDQSLPAYLSETSILRYQALHDLVAPATIPENVTGRHRLRIAIKKWRYLLETVGQVCDQDYGVTLDTLKGYQTLLGSLNDMVEFAVVCDSMKLPKAEKKAIKKALAQDTAAYFARFVEVVTTQPLQYSFHL